MNSNYNKSEWKSWGFTRTWTFVRPTLTHYILDTKRVMQKDVFIHFHPSVISVYDCNNKATNSILILALRLETGIKS